MQVLSGWLLSAGNIFFSNAFGTPNCGGRYNLTREDIPPNKIEIT